MCTTNLGQWQSYEDGFQSKPLLISEAIPDLIDLVWTDQPDELDQKIFSLSEVYSGKSYQVSALQLNLI